MLTLPPSPPAVGCLHYVPSFEEQLWVLSSREDIAAYLIDAFSPRVTGCYRTASGREVAEIPTIEP